MADVFPMDREFRVLPAQNGLIASYGSTSDENPSGGWYFSFVPAVDFDGQFAVMGRVPRVQPSDLTVPWVPIPYRRITLNNVASDWAIVSGLNADGSTNTNWVIAPSGPCQVWVPTLGMQAGLLIECAAGSCMVYAQKVTGSTIP